MTSSQLHIVTDQLLHVFEYSEFINKEKSNSLLEKASKNNNPDLFIIEELKKLAGSKFDEYIKLCIDSEIFSSKDYEEITMAAFKSDWSSKDVSTKEHPEEGVQEKEEKKLKQRSSQRTEPFSHDEIADLINQWANLFHSVPGHLLPKDNNIAYAQYQLYRFIDAWQSTSDFIFQTRKKKGAIFYEIQFKMNGQNETQDRTEYIQFDPHTQDSAPGSKTYEFYESVRKTIGETWRIESDMKKTQQDGQFSLKYKWENYDFRLSQMPVKCYGKNFPRYVIRISPEADSIKFDNIKMLPFLKRRYKKLILSKVPGAIIVTGPTGSGKTRTIYWALNEIDGDKYGILSAEKPIESNLYNVHQTEIDLKEREKKERFWLKDALLWIMRQALDFVFIGEMRDSEEIKETMTAALIGNKLITTFHTKNTIGTFLRLQEEGMTRNMIGNAILAVTAQRLIPTLCPHCSTKHPNSDQILEEMKRPFLRSERFLKKKLAEALDSEDIKDYDDLYIVFSRHLDFLSKEDMEEILQNIRNNIVEFNASLEQRSLKAFMLKAVEGYPNREEREYFFDLLKSPNIRVRNESGCSHPDCRLGYAEMRTPIFEFLEMEPSIQRYVQNPDTKLIDMEHFMADKGFLTLKNYGYYYVLSGDISFEDLNAFV